MAIKPLTKSQLVVIQAATGQYLMDPVIFLEEVGKRFGREVRPEEFRSETFQQEVQELYWEDFKEMCLNWTEDSGLILPKGTV